MKLTAGRVDSFVRNPSPDVRAVLVYGADSGLVKERADGLVLSVTKDPSDPFRSVEIPIDTLKSNPSMLIDETAALSFSGGRRVVRVRGATDSIADVLARLGGTETVEALVIVEAGELAPRSSLRKLFEGSTDMVALPCYLDDEGKLDELVHSTLSAHGLNASADAVAFLVANLGGDRAVTRGELEKLALYKGGAGSVTLEDAEAVVGDSTRTSIDAVVLAAFGGHSGSLDRALQKAFAEGVQPVAILRSASRHLLRLHLARGLMDDGRSADQAMQGLRPPVFFGLRAAFKTQLQRWDEQRLRAAMGLVLEAEMDCKTTGNPAETVCGRALIRLAFAARSAVRDR